MLNNTNSKDKCNKAQGAEAYNNRRATSNEVTVKNGTWYKLRSYYYLMRLHAPTGYLLCFFPAVFGLMLAYEQPTDLWYILLFFVGAVITRAAGCIINDIFDCKIDKAVERTQNRPIATGAVSKKEAIILLLILAICSLLILLTLSPTSILIGVIASGFIAIYPLMKRFTYYPQVFLGLTFNLGCLIGYASIKNAVSSNALILYAACGFWTVGYDTIYAFMDIKDDKIIGVKSTAIIWEKLNYKMIIIGFYIGFLALFTLAFHPIINISFIVTIVICAFLLLYSVIKLNINQTKDCFIHFNLNNYVGLLLFIAILLEKL